MDRRTSPSRTEAHAGDAAVAALLQEAIAIFTHDLSNPLQSLTVLLELAEEDARSDDERARLGRALAAAEGIRSMLQEFAALSRASRADRKAATVGQTIQQARTILGRRFERLSIDLTVDVSRVEDVRLPDGRVQWIVLGILLAGLAAMRAGDYLEGEMTLAGRRVPAGRDDGSVVLSFSISALRSPKETMHVIAFDPKRIRRLVPLAAVCGVSLAPTADGGIDVSFDPSPPDAPPAPDRST